jgi:hypothetical protein
MQIGQHFTDLPEKAKIHIPGIEHLLETEKKVDEALQWVENRKAVLLKRLEEDTHTLGLLESVPLRR